MSVFFPRWLLFISFTLFPFIQIPPNHHSILFNVNPPFVRALLKCVAASRGPILNPYKRSCIISLLLTLFHLALRFETPS